MLLSYPLMAAIQEISARIGRVTGCGIAANLRKNYPRWLLYATLCAVSAANVVNIGADIGAMADGLHLLLPGPNNLFIFLSACCRWSQFSSCPTLHMFDI